MRKVARGIDEQHVDVVLSERLADAGVHERSMVLYHHHPEVFPHIGVVVGEQHVVPAVHRITRYSDKLPVSDNPVRRHADVGHRSHHPVVVAVLAGGAERRVGDQHRARETHSCEPRLERAFPAECFSLGRDRVGIGAALELAARRHSADDRAVRAHQPLLGTESMPRFKRHEQVAACLSMGGSRCERGAQQRRKHPACRSHGPSPNLRRNGTCIHDLPAITPALARNCDSSDEASSAAGPRRRSTQSKASRAGYRHSASQALSRLNHRTSCINCTCGYRDLWCRYDKYVLTLSHATPQTERRTVIRAPGQAAMCAKSEKEEP